jgi:L-serine/L-threonine ammonia-lyase
MLDRTIHIQTPLYENPLIDARLGKRVFLKMECYQPTGSFKARGIGFKCQTAVASGKTHLISSSGGNAGYSAAYSGRMLGAKVTVVVPENTPQQARERIKGEGAELIVHGSFWDQANEHALQLVQETGGAYIHPFDDPQIWEGHESIISECIQQCPQKPEVVIVAVGGGGLLSGVVGGLHHFGWEDVPVMSVETEGADSFAKSLQTGRHITLPAITSIAHTLGALKVTSRAIEWSKHHPIFPQVVSDDQAVSACLQFANDLRVVVEPACGAALSLLYDNKHLVNKYGSILVIVCGGAGVTIEQLLRYKAEAAS